MGIMRALGRPIFGYSNDGRLFLERVTAFCGSVPAPAKGPDTKPSHTIDVPAGSALWLLTSMGPTRSVRQFNTLHQLALELGQAAEHGQHESSMGRSGIGPRVTETRRETNESSASEERRNRIANALGATRARKAILRG